MFRTKKITDNTKYLGLDVFDQLTDIKKLLGTPTGLVHFLVKNKGIVKASFNTFKNKDKYEIFNLALQVDSLTHLPSLANLLGVDWSGEIVLSATYVNYNEVPLVLQTGKPGDLFVNQQPIYPHSDPILIGAVTEILTEAKRIRITPKELAKQEQSKVIPTNELLKLLSKRNNQRQSKIDKMIDKALHELNRSGAIVLFFALQESLGGNVSLTLTGCAWRGGGLPFDHLPPFQLTPNAAPKKYIDWLENVKKHLSTTDDWSWDEIALLYDHSELGCLRFGCRLNFSYSVRYFRELKSEANTLIDEGSYKYFASRLFDMTDLIMHISAKLPSDVTKSWERVFSKASTNTIEPPKFLNR